MAQALVHDDDDMVIRRDGRLKWREPKRIRQRGADASGEIGQIRCDGGPTQWDEAVIRDVNLQMVVTIDDRHSCHVITIGACWLSRKRLTRMRVSPGED